MPQVYNFIAKYIIFPAVIFYAAYSVWPYLMWASVSYLISDGHNVFPSCGYSSFSQRISFSFANSFIFTALLIGWEKWIKQKLFSCMSASLLIIYLGVTVKVLSLRYEIIHAVYPYDYSFSDVDLSQPMFYSGIIILGAVYFFRKKTF